MADAVDLSHLPIAALNPRPPGITPQLWHIQRRPLGLQDRDCTHPSLESLRGPSTENTLLGPNDPTSLTEPDTNLQFNLH